MNWTNFRIWAGKKLLEGTGFVVVPRREVKKVEELCADLEEYIGSAGGIRARDRVGRLAGELVKTANGFTGGN